MVLNLLDIQKFEDTNVQLKPKEFLIDEVITKALDKTKFLAEQKSITLVRNIHSNAISFFDFDLIMRVLENILINAIKYTHDNGQIRLYTEVKHDSIQLSIADNGQGIPKDKTKYVFDKFFQVQEKKVGNVRSTGLGLTFCKMVIDAHKGKIGVSSELGKGATFWFTLPIKSANVKSLKAPEQQVFFNPQQPDIQLNNNEKELLKPHANTLRAFEVYDYSDIEETLNNITTLSDSVIVAQWVEAMRDTLTSLDENKYSQLLDLIEED
jgi:hypothetical protein